MIARLFFFFAGVFTGVFADQNYQLPRLYPLIQRYYEAARTAALSSGETFKTLEEHFRKK